MTTMKQNRPLSPHLSIYKIQISSTLSILHRITGVGLFFGFLILGWLLIALLVQKMDIGLVDYNLTLIFNNIMFRIFFYGIVSSLYYHFFNGIRHLCWDAGVGFSIRAMTWSGIAVMLLSIGASIVTIWFAVSH